MCVSLSSPASQNVTKLQMMYISKSNVVFTNVVMRYFIYLLLQINA